MKKILVTSTVYDVCQFGASPNETSAAAMAATLTRRHPSKGGGGAEKFAIGWLLGMARL
jgi:hypothetical protein